MIHPYTFDRTLSALVGKLPTKVRPVMLFASFIASPAAVILIISALIAAALLKDNQQLLISGVVLLVLSPLAEISKYITRRKRPETLYVEQMRFKSYSFPSSHTYVATLLFGYTALAVSALHPLSWIIALSLLFLVLLVGVSRVYLGAHFPSDVIAGWIFGSVIMYLVYVGLG